MLPKVSTRIIGRIILHIYLIAQFFFVQAIRTWAQSFIYEINTIPLTGETAGFVGTSILQDSDGFMWFGSIQGLFRYDGVNFKRYVFDPSEEITSGIHVSGLTNDLTEYLFEDDEGFIWFTNFNSVVRFDRRSESFQHFIDPTIRVIHQAIECSDGYIWLGSRSGLSRFDKKSGTFRHYPPDQSDRSSQNITYIDKVFEDSKGVLWLTIRSTGKLWTFNRESETYYHIDNIPAPVQHIYEDRLGRLWITTSSGLYLYRRRLHTFRRYLYRTDDPDRLSSQHLGSILQDSSGNFWLNTMDGIYLYSEDLEKLDYWKFPEENLPLWNEEIVGVPKGKLYMDPSGIIWFLLGNKVGYLTRRTNNFTTYQPVEPSSPEKEVIDSGNRIFVSTPAEPSSGLYMVDRNNHTFARITVDPENNVEDFGFSLKDMRGTLWIATLGNGVYRSKMPKEGKLKFEQVFSNPKDSSNLPNLDVLHLFEDSEGRIWMEARGHWPCFWDPESDQIVHLINNPHSTDTLPGKYPTGLARGRVQGETNSGILLASHKIYGMFAIIPPLIKVSEHAVMATDIIRFRPEKGNKVISGWDTYISPDDITGTIWARGVYGGFLKLIPVNPERKDDFTVRPRFYSTKDGLPISDIAVFLKDDQGYFWLGTRRGGLSQFDPETETFKNYNANNGIPDLQFDLVYKTEDGELIFHSENGYFISFYPDSIRSNRKIPSIVLTDFKIDQQSISPWDKSVLDTTITFTKQIELSYDQNNITLSYAALNYLQSSRNQYRYRLEGYNTNWIHAENRNSVDYTNLRPGKYVFRVIGSNNDGIWNEEGANLQIHIAPPPWKTAWAYLGYGIILFGIILWFRRYFLNRARMRTAVEVARVEQEKIMELDQMKSRFFANISHEFRTPLTLILGPLEDKLKKSSFSIEWPRDLVTTIHRNASRLQRLINQLLDLSKLETGKLKLKISEGNLEESLKIIILSFLSLAERKHVKYTYNLPGNPILVWYDNDKLEKIVTNLLSNAFKFTTEGGMVRVALEYELSSESGSPQYAAIEVCDTGKGIPKEQLDRIFDRFHQVSDSDVRQSEGTGIGLALSRELAELCRGAIHVESEYGKGSTFTVRLPVSRESFKDEEIVTTAPSQEVGPAFGERELIVKEPAKQPKDAPLVLIVEDNHDLRRYISGNLETRYRILTAENGKTGLELALEQIPDLIISDVMMPVMDGIEMCRNLKTDERTDHIPVIILTAKADRGSKMEGLHTGADDYIIKPFDAGELLIRVENLIRQRRKLRDKFRREFIESDPFTKVIPDMKEEFLTRIVDCIKKHLSEPEFGVEQLAGEIGFSRSQLHRKLRSLTGYVPNRFIRYIRLKHAVRMFCEGNRNITQVLFSVGFNTPSHFSKSFRELYGMNPSEYLKKISE